MDHNVNSVQVFSIDEEKLKFRVIIAIDGLRYRQAPPLAPAAVLDGDGQYEVDVPVPTFIANNEKYNQCLIKCDTFTASAGIAAVTPTWAQGAGVPGGGAIADGVSINGAAVELQLGVASSQSTATVINTDAAGGPAAGVGIRGDKFDSLRDISGFRQLIPGQVVNVGNGLAFSPAAGGYSWLGMMRDLSPLLCANPFGQKIRVRLVDPIGRRKMCIMNSAGLNNGDIGKYYIQLDVTMIPNKNGC
jgi:hypothetical protein